MEKKMNPVQEAKRAAEQKRAEEAAQQQINEAFNRKREAFAVSFMQADIMAGKAVEDPDVNADKAISRADALINKLWGIEFKKIEKKDGEPAEK